MSKEQSYFPHATKFWGPHLGECFVVPNRDKGVFTTIWLRSRRPDLLGVCKKAPNYLPFSEGRRFMREALVILLQEEGFAFHTEGRYHIVRRV